MPDVANPTRIDLPTVILSALPVVVPLLHSVRLAEPFALPKEIALVTGALLLTLIAIAGRLGRRPVAALRSPVLLLAALLLACAALAGLLSFNPRLAAGGWMSLAAGATIGWAVARFVVAPRGAALLLRSLLTGAALVAAAALAQAFYPGLHLAPGGWSLIPAGTGATTLGSPGLTFQYLLLALPAGVGAAALSRGPGRALCGAGLGLVAAALLFAGPPEVWSIGLASLALLLVSACLRVMARGGRFRDCIPGAGDEGLRTALIALVTMLAVLALSRTPFVSSTGWPPMRASLLTPTSGDPAVDRGAAIAGTAPLLRRHPLGVGPGLWRHAFLEVAWNRIDSSPFTLAHQSSHAGNAFIEMFAETGAAGGLLFLLLLGAVLCQSAGAARLGEATAATLGFTAFNTLGTFAFASLYGSIVQEPTPALVFWMMVGLSQRAAAGAALPRLLRAGVPDARPGGSRLPAVAALVAWIAAAALLAGAARESLAASRQTLLSQAARQSGSAERALAALESPEALRSPAHLPHFLAAQAAFEAGEMERAVARFDMVIDRSPFFIAAWLGRAQAHQALGRYDLAEQDLDRALAIWPGHAETRMARARLDRVRGRPIEALERYRGVILDDRSKPEPYFRMGELLAELGRHDEAIQAFRACLSKDPRYPGAHLRIGDSLAEEGALEMAVEYYKSAILAAPADPAPRLRVANSLYGASRFCEARIALEGARDVETDPVRRRTILELIDKVRPLCREETKKGG
jgi:tetratricopeptide (TPR) repeat protein